MIASVPSARGAAGAALAPHRSSAGLRPGLVRAREGSGGVESLATGARVLIVEDEYFVALDAEDALTDAGFRVVGVAATAEDALALARAERPDLVLMDIRLGGSRDGIEAAAEIRRELGIPSLFATAHADAATRLRGEAAASPLGWLSKPYTQAEVVAAVRLALAEARRRGPSGRG
ncbi:response regulator [Crenalkalicoccus roseus]|uniref:response regulator n=1 Tax=Crenalkalicoccus roseus TaxID=1485588 RepID=UPI0010809873|nr:response regulator [Crenalkalicoccus roseus]